MMFGRCWCFCTIALTCPQANAAMGRSVFVRFGFIMMLYLGILFLKLGLSSYETPLSIQTYIKKTKQQTLTLLISQRSCKHRLNLLLLSLYYTFHVSFHPHLRASQGFPSLILSLIPDPTYSTLRIIFMKKNNYLREKK